MQQWRNLLPHYCIQCIINYWPNTVYKIQFCMSICTSVLIAIRNRSVHALPSSAKVVLLSMNISTGHWQVGTSNINAPKYLRIQLRKVLMMLELAHNIEFREMWMFHMQIKVTSLHPCFSLNNCRCAKPSCIYPRRGPRTRTRKIADRVSLQRWSIWQGLESDRCETVRVQDLAESLCGKFMLSRKGNVCGAWEDLRGRPTFSKKKKKSFLYHGEIRGLRA